MIHQSHRMFKFHQLSVQYLKKIGSNTIIFNGATFSFATWKCFGYFTIRDHSSKWLIFFFEFKLKEYFDMTTCKTHIILALMTRVLFVQESIEDCLQEYSGSFADAIVSAVLLFLKND